MVTLILATLRPFDLGPNPFKYKTDFKVES